MGRSVAASSTYCDGAASMLRDMAGGGLAAHIRSQEAYAAQKHGPGAAWRTRCSKGELKNIEATRMYPMAMRRSRP